MKKPRQLRSSSGGNWRVTGAASPGGSVLTVAREPAIATNFARPGDAGGAASGLLGGLEADRRARGLGWLEEAAQGFEVTICDLKFATSSGLSWKRKSSGNRSRLRLIA